MIETLWYIVAPFWAIYMGFTALWRLWLEGGELHWFWKIILGVNTIFLPIGLYMLGWEIWFLIQYLL